MPRTRSVLLVACLAVSLGSYSAVSASTTTAVNKTGYITVSGGIKLAYDLTLPAATGRFPVALEYNHYNAGEDNSAESPGSDVGMLFAAGFAVLGVNEPGSGCSGGVDNYVNVNEWGRVGAEVVEWAAAQPWSTGHIGMVGSSWTGLTQIGIASFRPKGLDAITPYHITTDFYRDVAYPGGVYNSAFVDYYSSYLATENKQVAQAAISHGDKQCAADYKAYVAPDARDSLARNAPRHPFDDSYWQTSPGEYLSRIDIPVLGCQSWQDGLVSSRATEVYYDALNQKTSWFIGMNGAHGSCEFPEPLNAMVKFMRYYVAGVHNGWPQTPHVTILHDVSGGVTGPPSPAWTSTYQSWSQLMKPVTLDFQPNRALTASRPGNSGQASFSGPTPSQSGNWTASQKAGTSVSYTSPPLAHDVDIFGPGSVNLWLSSTARDTDIEVIISEVRPDGMDQYVQAGWLNVAQRKLAPSGSGPDDSSALRPYQIHTRAGLQPLIPGQPVYARVELMPFEHMFRKGSSIQITIDSASGKVQSTGLWGLTPPAGHFTDTIYVSPERQSQVVLGLIPGATAHAPLPACGSIIGEPCRHN